MSNAHQTLLKLANSLAKFAEDSEKISLPIFTVKLVRAQEQYPEDYTIGMLSRVVGKMANSEKLFISRAEVKDLYEKFYSRNTKFASVFGEELGKIESQPEASKSSLIGEDHSTDIMQAAFDNVVDPVLANALNQAFGGTKGADYTKTVAKHAESICQNRFKDLGFTVKSEVVCGKENVLVCNVSFETPRGTSSILVPVETADNKVLYAPSMFIGNAGAEELNQHTVYSYLTTWAGDKLDVRAEEVLKASLIAKGNDHEISNVDLALTKLNASKESKADYLGPQILGTEVEVVNPNLILNLPQVEDTEIEAIAKTFDSELGFASFKFGSKLIEQGHSLIQRQLNSCGATTHHIAVLSSNDESITYSVALNGGSVAFKVPLKIESKNALPPTILLCNGSIKSFDKTSVAELLREEGFDRVAASSASPLYGIKPSELVNIVKSAVAENNYIKAEDALNVLSNSDDEKAYEVALSAFTHGLTHQHEEVEETTKCAMIVNTNSSQFEICGHTGLPVHKVYQDKHGNCQPLYRRGMADSYEGASFMNSKVYF
jgi:hypothetical protein